MGYAGQYMYGSEFSRILTGMEDVVKTAEVDAIAVTGFSGVIVGTIIARSCNIPMICIRKDGEKPASYQQTVKVAHFRESTTFEYKNEIKYFIIDDLISSGGTVKHIMNTINLNFDKQATCLGILLYECYTCRTEMAWKDIHVPIFGADHFRVNGEHTCRISLS